MNIIFPILFVLFVGIMIWKIGKKDYTTPGVAPHPPTPIDPPVDPTPTEPDQPDEPEVPVDPHIPDHPC